MTIDEKATIQSILLALKVEGVKTADVARQIQGISEKPFRSALKSAGYEFSNKAPKGWYFVGEGEQPLDNSIFDYVKRGSSPKNSNSPKVIQSNTEVANNHMDSTESNIEVTTNSPIPHQQFTNDEVGMIKDMLVDWQQVSMQEATPGHESEPGPSLHDRIKHIPQGDKTRKTIVLDQTMGDKLDSFCKTERVQKSDVLHLALMDFLGK